MARKQQFSAQDIIDAAFRLAREKGRDGLTVTAITNEMHCSTMPVYSHFNNMEGLEDAVMERAWGLMRDYVSKSHNKDPWVSTAIGYVRFALEEKQLFRCMLDGKYPDKQREMLMKTWGFLSEMLAEYKQFEGMSEEKTRKVRFARAMLTHGFATSVNFGWHDKTDPHEIENFLTDVSHGLLQGLKGLGTEG